MRLIQAAMAAALLASATPAAAQDTARLKAIAAQVTITRDDWGIAHIRGKADAQAVFGMVYAQAEDDFNRVEINYATNLGWLAQAEGESAIWSDLRQRLWIDETELKALYAKSPPRLKTLMNAWADGLNYYLATHPAVKPKAIKRFEPWMALSFTEGSIGGDISRVSLADLQAFYGGAKTAALDPYNPAADDALAVREPQGSNGAALAPKVTRDGHAMLLINPHTSFFFRSELQMQSDEGLNAYGAVTWGQPFIYQGFNAHSGWMHTTSTADTTDEFAETIVRKGDQLFYRYGAEERPVRTRTIVIPYKTASGGAASRSFQVFDTHHGPIIRAEGDKWIAFAIMNKPIEALQQSFDRTKTHTLAAFLKVSELAANSSNDTLYANDKGEIALLMPQFMPTRDNRFDYTKPVDGSDPATDWKGNDALAKTPSILRPGAGWVYNSNDGPWWATGASSPKRDAFPRYADSLGQNARTPHALEVFDGKSGFTLQGLIDAAYDSHLPAFSRTLPGLFAAYDALPAADPLRARLAEPVAALRGWDARWSAASTPTSVAVFWGEALFAKVAPAAKAAGLSNLDYMADRATAAERITALDEAVARLTTDFGSWKTPWGEINRYQRNDGAIVQTFDDAKASIPVPFTSAQWGSLASFGARRYDGTKRYYGTSGNSFVAAIEFGPKVSARAVSAGGESGNPASKHFADQAERYASGDLRTVYFHPDQLTGHIERTYRPGE
ncbi:MAG: penicillin acylase family protein [Caulobacterales bacterium]|nr:penicillin acylase family protein [Caulobacterales bacterium]